MVKVLILAGGNSNEREVSLRSGGSVKSALEIMNHEVGIADPSLGSFDINLAKEYDVVFSVLHGSGGEDGVMQRRLDDIGAKYVGSKAAASKLTFNKWQYRQKLQKHGYNQPQGELVDTKSYQSSNLKQKKHVLKPVSGGSSIDVVIVREPEKLDLTKISEVFSRHRTMLHEELIEGIEITVPVLGESALPVIEIIPPSKAEFDYDNKYNGATQELCPPKNVSQKTQKQAMKLAEEVHKICGCDHYSRTDMMIDNSGDIYILETNTLPGMTSQSLFPRAGKTAGIPMHELCDQLVAMALRR